MTKILILLSLAACFACTSTRPKSDSATATAKTQTPAVDVKQVNKTMVRLKSQINELESLEEQVYSKSIKGDPVLEKKLEEKISAYGTVENLQADLRMLHELKSQNKPAGTSADISDEEE